MEVKCLGEHEFFVAEVVAVERTGAVHVLAICRHCGEFLNRHVQVSQPHEALKLLRDFK